MAETYTLRFTILLAFAIILFWRGAWGLIDIYLFPQNYELSLWVSLLLGLGILLVTKTAGKHLV